MVQPPLNQGNSSGWTCGWDIGPRCRSTPWANDCAMVRPFVALSLLSRVRAPIFIDYLILERSRLFIGARRHQELRAALVIDIPVFAAALDAHDEAARQEPRLGLKQDHTQLLCTVVSGIRDKRDNS